jgi:hypothetical protein
MAQVTYLDLVDLARTCMKRARQSASPSVAAAFRALAKDYQQQAAELNGGKLPDIDESLD